MTRHHPRHPETPSTPWADAVNRDLEILRSLSPEYDQLVRAIESEASDLEVLERKGFGEATRCIRDSVARLAGAVVEDLTRPRPVPEVAQITGYQETHLHKLIRDGKLPDHPREGRRHLTLLEVRRYRRQMAGRATTRSTGRDRAPAEGTKLQSEPRPSKPDLRRRMKSVRPLPHTHDPTAA